ncbi:MAG TPA: hypothetical protein PKY77_24415 [Phycisphaerae bacterium]|nr:hypothetical protein [Phycisphaerae bacterium]HRY70674.1 hypothetical protein [Phycisphaerae bacterium]HSA28731.1 hypothetical protein [Phycisphaerae bacterium]
MTLGIRKLIVLSIVAGVLLLGNLLMVATWLQEHGVIDWARHVRAEYLTGTAITIILVLLALMVRPGPVRASWLRRCSVCDHVVVGHGPYCSECGSRVQGPGCRGTC